MERRDLFRESDISYISDKDRGLFKHVFVPNPSARKSYSCVSEASGVMERMVLTSDPCRHPVSPIPPDPDENGNFCDRSSDDAPVYVKKKVDISVLHLLASWCSYRHQNCCFEPLRQHILGQEGQIETL